jgi:hypothetical protein
MAIGRGITHRREQKMINGCVVGRDDCGCDCHRTPGVKHVMACCDKPAFETKYEMAKALIEAAIKSYDTDRDPGDETPE